MQTLFDFITYTKGVEYLIAIVFLLVFVAFWRFANTVKVPSLQPVSLRGVAEKIGDLVGGFLLPESVYFHPGHAWAKAGGNDVLTVGIDDFGQKLVGKIDAVTTPSPGERLNQGERAWTLRANGKTFDMLAPVDGEIVAVNGDVVNAPEKINQDPYGEGWLLKVKNPRKAANLKGLLSGVLAKRWLEEARAKLMVNSDYNLGTLLTDAGPPREGIARVIDRENWDEIVKDFFLTIEE